MTTHLDPVMAFVSRREFLCSHPPKVCPVCPEKHQFQLVGYIHQTPAIWKCRRCNSYFTHEPNGTNE